MVSHAHNASTSRVEAGGSGVLHNASDASAGCKRPCLTWSWWSLQGPKSCMRNGSDDDLYRTVKGVGIKKVRAVLSSDFWNMCLSDRIKLKTSSPNKLIPPASESHWPQSHFSGKPMATSLLVPREDPVIQHWVLALHASLSEPANSILGTLKLHCCPPPHR